MAQEKISRQLTESLKDPDGESPVDVVLELSDPNVAMPPDAQRSQQIAARKEAFSRHAEQVADQIKSLGGEVTGEAWLNSTLKARISKKMVPALSRAPQVKYLDLPRPIKAE